VGKGFNIGIVGLCVLWLLGVVSIATWLFYLSRFLVLDFSFLDVFANASADMPLYYRAAASLVSVGGVFLYISAVLGAVALAAKSRRVAATSLLFLIASVAAGAFERWPGGGPGIGLNPLLRSVWAGPHPLLVAGAYAFVLAAVAERRLAPLLLRLAWVLATAGMATGAYWAYTTFGWGGYWAWDPVETALLVLWLFLTAYLHREGGAAIYMSAAAVFLAMAVTYSGVSPLHSFVGVIWLGRLALAPSLAFFALALLALARERSRDVAYLGLLVLGIYLYWLLAPSVAAPLFGTTFVAPSGDGAIRLIHPVFIPAAAAAFVIIMKRVFGLKAAAAWLSFSVVAAVALWHLRPWSPLSHPLTNLSVYLLALLAVGVAAASVAQLKKSPASSLAHLGLALLVAGVALSGPYSYHIQYAVVVPLGVGESAVVPLHPFNEVHVVELASYQVEKPREVVSIPPYLDAYLGDHLAKAVLAWGELSGRVEFRRFAVNGTEFVVAFGDFPPGLHQVGGTWIYVNSTVETPVGRLLVGAVGRGDSLLLFSPTRYSPASAVFTCGVETTAVNYFAEVIHLVLDGSPLSATIRYELAGEFKLVRGLVHGVATVSRGLDDVYISATTEVAQWKDLTVHRLLVLAARENLNSCKVLGAWLLLSTYAGRPLTAEEVEEIMKLNPQGYVLLVKKIPFVNLVWAGTALVTSGGIWALITRRRKVSAVNQLNLWF